MSVTKYKYEKIAADTLVPAHIICHRTPKGIDPSVLSHYHKEIELNLIIKGYATYAVSGNIVDVNAGELIVINSCDIHSTKCDVVKNDGELKVLTLQFDYDFLDKFIDNFQNGRFTLERLNDEEYQTITRLMTELYHMYETDKVFPLKVSSYLYLIAHLLSHSAFVIEQRTADDSTNNAPSKSFAKINKAIDYIKQNYHQELSLENVASFVNMSPCHFSRIFKLQTSITYSQFLLSTRLSVARLMLIDSNDTVEKIAYATGFANVQSFINNFKKHYMQTPKQYRQGFKRKS